MTKPGRRDPATLTNDELFQTVLDACAEGRLGAALEAADERCRPHRARAMRDVLAPCRVWPAMQGYTEAQTRGLQDRIDQYNAHVGSSDA
jgi:hypothetical protein